MRISKPASLKSSNGHVSNACSEDTSFSLENASELEKQSINFRKHNSLASLFKGNNKSGLVKYFTIEVVNAAKKFSAEFNHENLSELISEGYIALENYVNSHNLKSLTVRQILLTVIENRMKNYLLSDELDRMHVDYSTRKLKKTLYDHIERVDRNLDLETFYDELNSSLDRIDTKNGANHFRDYHLGEKDDTYEKIALRYGCTRSMVGMNVKSVERKISDKIRFSKLNSVAREVVKYYDIRQSFSSKSEDEVDYRNLLERLKENLGNRTPEEFKRFYKLSVTDFLEFLRNLYPDYGKKKAIRLVALSEAEKQGLEKDIDGEVLKIERPENILREIRRLKDVKNTQAAPQTSFEKVRDIYFPLFAIDPEKCLTDLQAEAEGVHKDSVIRVYQEVLSYFTKSSKLKVPGIKSELDHYQKADLLCLSTKNSYIVGSDMGTGKSLIAISYGMMKNAQKILVVSTKSGVYSTWGNEFKKHLNDPSFQILNNECLKDPDFKIKERWNLVTYSTGAVNIEKLRELGFDMVILDESHKINNFNTSQSVSFLSLDPQYKLAVSGSVFKNKRLELHPVLNWLFPNDFPSREDFEETFCSSREGMAALQLELRSRMIYHSKAEVLRLPEVHHETIEIEMDDVFRAEYEAMEHDFVTWYNATSGSKGIHFLSQAAIVKLHSLRQKVIEAKQEVIKTLVKEHIRKNKIVLYSTYVDAAENFAKKFKKRGVCYLDGRTGNEDRRIAVEQFKDNDDKRMFVVTAAGGESIDLTPASVIIYGNKPLTYADEKQMLDRLHRRGQRKNVKAFHVIVKGTIEEKIQALIERKKIEFSNLVEDKSNYMQWFEESEKSNLRELIKTMIL